jgi:hypothetical protein
MATPRRTIEQMFGSFIQESPGRAGAASRVGAARRAMASFSSRGEERSQVSPLFARRSGWRVSAHPSGMLIWRSPAGRHYLQPGPDSGSTSPGVS